MGICNNLDATAGRHDNDSPTKACHKQSLTGRIACQRDPTGDPENRKTVTLGDGAYHGPAPLLFSRTDPPSTGHCLNQPKTEDSRTEAWFCCPARHERESLFRQHPWFLPGGSTLHELELVIFDLAGTTVEDRGQVPGAFTAALAEHGIEVTAEQVKGVRGLSKRQAVLHFVPAGSDQARLAEEAYASFRAHLAQQYTAESVRAIPGAAPAFRWLREHGVRVALNTGFDRAITDLLLGALGWAGGTVDAVVCGDDVTRGRPAPYLVFRAMELTGAGSVHRVATVGDTTLDLQAGYNAGIRWNIGVLSGAHDRQSLARAPHTHLIPSVAEVTRLWIAA